MGVLNCNIFLPAVSAVTVLHLSVNSLISVSLECEMEELDLLLMPHIRVCQ